MYILQVFEHLPQVVDVYIYVYVCVYVSGLVACVIYQGDLGQSYPAQTNVRLEWPAFPCLCLAGPCNTRVFVKFIFMFLCKFVESWKGSEPPTHAP